MHWAEHLLQAFQIYALGWPVPQARGLVGYFYPWLMPTSLVQFFVPRVELHLFYNTIVFIPMIVAMYYHLFPSAREASAQKCTCGWHHETALA